MRTNGGINDEGKSENDFEGRGHGLIVVVFAFASRD
jgi:hypothetical protein